MGVVATGIHFRMPCRAIIYRHRPCNAYGWSPPALLETDSDLGGDKLRCAHLNPNAVVTHLPAKYLHPEQALPRHTDPVLALRILVDCLTKLKRLDDVEQFLSEGMEREIRRVAEREQAETHARLEQRRELRTVSEGVDGRGDSMRGDREEDELKDIRVHFNNLLKSFGGEQCCCLFLTIILLSLTDCCENKFLKAS